MWALWVPLGSPREGLTVEPLVGNRPVEVLRRQHLAAVEAVVCDPVCTLVSMGQVGDSGLVCPELGSLLLHSAIALEPGEECSYRWLVGTAGGIAGV